MRTREQAEAIVGEAGLAEKRVRAGYRHRPAVAGGASRKERPKLTFSERSMLGATGLQRDSGRPPATANTPSRWSGSSEPPGLLCFYLPTMTNPQRTLKGLGMSRQYRLLIPVAVPLLVAV